ncbi:ribonuclease HI [Desulfovirgula thermocuniculi]|uniref:ribonuclease HI n=1 Tax=Desulfovirgula thermocuniculi TaxID=348842 RepID=UPI0004184040|nr:ribonuclease HI [Desulfovirgula thermocuniculi]
MAEIEIYTDGACSGNPGPGGYGVILRCGPHTRELSGGFARTTNNRMELIAVIKGLEALKRPSRVTLYTDSRYIYDAVTKGWLWRWKARGWRREGGERVKNVDLWERLLAQLNRHQVTFVWVKGHADNPYNNRCDRLAQEASRAPSLPEDPGYREEEHCGGLF